MRYDGRDAARHSPLLQRWADEGRIVALCPEVAGGLPIPRAAAEIEPGGGGLAVWKGAARVLTRQGLDVSQAFVCGARQALALIQRHDIVAAVLKEGSPSCGTAHIYDGRFQGRRVPGSGVTAACLAQAGVPVFSELGLEAADAVMRAHD
ncbi:hypothetical protein D554_1159 [Bordetella holmesii 30539]|uniref:PF04463 family protein n=1 Tax=Bordetella holmesii 1058 TaxID=1247648 RepID=A0ABN0S3V9_9BORD|nr:hypothetical protein D560_1691 [Bordetella holmesii ATCC 51541]AIT26352.1 hypothetical protein D558_1680 [Bordetella holmesii 44057]EXF89953.1 hypothetical protein D554_1159 [Bordetella holmesii 30539]EXX96162.1 hypothetical protein D559_3606 [Bordetella holmesii 1058]SUV91264.1 Uncharacterized conserved protein [Bordetella holmesii]